jgi:CRISPR-associated protein Csb3
MSFEVNVDLTNPGQFFGCCGLFELASRLGPATASFAGARFHVECEVGLSSLVDQLRAAPLRDIDEQDV